MIIICFLFLLPLECQPWYLDDQVEKTSNIFESFHNYLLVS
jgi:hypothetical protein